MDSISHFKWLLLGKILGIMILAINIPIAKSHNVENTFVSNTFRLHESDDKIQLKIIEKEIEQFEVILPSHDNRYKRDISSPFVPSDNSSAFDNIDNEIKNIQEHLPKLTNSTSLNTADKSKISVLETKLENLQESLNNLKTDLRKKDEQHEKQILSTIRKFETIILNGIVQSILMRQFSLANLQLQSADDATFRAVFQLVYHHQQADNFDLILNFGDSIQNFKLKFKVYKTLYLETKTNDTITTEKLLLLTQNLKKILTSKSTDVNKSKTQLFICNLWSENQRSAVEAISVAFFNDHYLKKLAEENNADIFLHCNFANRYRNVSDIYEKVIENVFDAVSFQDILDKAFCNLQIRTNIAESAALNEAVFHKLEALKKLSTNDVIPLARRIRAVMGNSNFPRLDLEFRNQHEYMKSKLPVSVKNLVFSSVICLKNSRYNEYLFAGTTEHQTIDLERRLVFTWIPQNRTDPTFKWNANFRDDNGIFLVNKAYNEYLFGCNRNKYDDRRRYVFTWRGYKKGDSLLDSTWNVEVVDENSVRIKNRFHGEYLYPDCYEQRDEHRRHVFTYIPKKKTYDSQWNIIDCS